MDLRDFEERITIPPISTVQNERLIGCKPLSVQTFIKLCEDGHMQALTLQFRKSTMLHYKLLEDEETITLMVGLEAEHISEMLKSGEE